MDKAFIGLENSLIKLGLTNVSLTTVPELPLPHLRELHLSGNELPSIPQELAQNLSSLTLLDLSLNDLTSVPKITHSLPQLRWEQNLELGLLFVDYQFSSHLDFQVAVTSIEFNHKLDECHIFWFSGEDRTFGYIEFELVYSWGTNDSWFHRVHSCFQSLFRPHRQVRWERRHRWSHCDCPHTRMYLTSTSRNWCTAWIIYVRFGSMHQSRPESLPLQHPQASSTHH